MKQILTIVFLVFLSISLHAQDSFGGEGLNTIEFYEKEYAEYHTEEEMALPNIFLGKWEIFNEDGERIEILEFSENHLNLSWDGNGEDELKRWYEWREIVKESYNWDHYAPHIEVGDPLITFRAGGGNKVFKYELIDEDTIELTKCIMGMTGAVRVDKFTLHRAK